MGFISKYGVAQEAPLGSASASASAGRDTEGSKHGGTKKKATKTGFLSAAGVVKEEVEGQIRDGRQLSRREEKKQ